MSERIDPYPLQLPLLTTLSRWVALVEKRIQNAGEALSDKQSPVDISSTTGAQSLREGLPPPDLATIKDFLRFIASVSDGIIDDETERVTADSLLEHFCGMVLRWIRSGDWQPHRRRRSTLGIQRKYLLSRGPSF